MLDGEHRIEEQALVGGANELLQHYWKLTERAHMQRRTSIIYRFSRRRRRHHRRRQSYGNTITLQQ